MLEIAGYLIVGAAALAAVLFGEVILILGLIRFVRFLEPWAFGNGGEE